MLSVLRCPNLDKLHFLTGATLLKVQATITLAPGYFILWLRLVNHGY